MKKLWAPWRLEYIENAEKETGCIFCEKPAEGDDKKNLIVYRSEFCFVILNKYPYNNGHLMVVPFLHESDFVKLPDSVLSDVNKTIKLVIKSLNNCMKPHGMNIGINLGRVAGAGIDSHLHYHIVPRWNGDTNFMPILTNTKVISEALEQTWAKLHVEMENLAQSRK